MVSVMDPVQYWHADGGGLYKLVVGEALYAWNFGAKEWFPVDKTGQILFSRRQEATEVDQIDEAELNSFVKKGVPVRT